MGHFNDRTWHLLDAPSPAVTLVLSQTCSLCKRPRETVQVDLARGLPVRALSNITTRGSPLGLCGTGYHSKAAIIPSDVPAQSCRRYLISAFSRFHLRRWNPYHCLLSAWALWHFPHHALFRCHGPAVEWQPIHRESHTLTAIPRSRCDLAATSTCACRYI